jgi:tetratricopeptide (TPR) repeat protein
MKVTSQKPRKLLRLLQRAEEKLNKVLSFQYRKAGVITCLFLFLYAHASHAQTCLNPDGDSATHEKVLNLEYEMRWGETVRVYMLNDHYMAGLSECLEMLLTEDHSKYAAYENRFSYRLDLDRSYGSKDEINFLRAELKLQWAFVDLKFGHEFDAALKLRDAYRIATDLRKRSPNFLPIRKTTGLLNVIVGSVPEKYDWILSLLGMEGSVDEGLRDLNSLRNTDCFLSDEADLLYALVQGYILQKPDSGLMAVEDVLKSHPGQRVGLFLAAALAMKNSQSEVALEYLSRLNEHRSGIPIFYSKYLEGEVFLHKASYPEAIGAYKDFLEGYQGQNYIKDAQYKIGLCYWLSGDEGNARSNLKKAMSTGRAESEADKAAERSLQTGKLPNVQLSKARYFTDGGFYAAADSMLNSIQHSSLPGKHDQTEYYYRKARLAHKINRLDAAKLFYQQAIDLAGNEPWYFAPNSCLQMGYIALDQGRKSEAKKYFEKALEYKKHEYKNSIDAKAKSGLARLRRK